MRPLCPERLGPRPLALHLGQARGGRGSPGGVDTGLLEPFLRGLQAYWRHPYRRRMAEPPLLWEHGAARLLDYGPPDGFPALIVPSLINRAYILDLMPERSLVRYLSRRGVRPLLLDWGEPGPAELRLTLGGYIEGHLCEALEQVRAAHAASPALVGYCMGGVLALALACLRPEAIAGIGLLAAPWDFHRGGPLPAAFDGLVAKPAAAVAGGLGGLPVDFIQMLFAGLAQEAVARKFARFASLDPDSLDARAFVAIEDWLNDGVPLAAEVARECLIGWYVENRPVRGLWRIGGRTIRPEALDMPAFVAIPARDRIVPPASAGALAAGLPRAEVRRVAGGHIGMVVGGRAEDDLWQPLAAWLHSLAAMQESP